MYNKKFYLFKRKKKINLIGFNVLVSFLSNGKRCLYWGRCLFIKNKYDGNVNNSITLMRLIKKMAVFMNVSLFLTSAWKKKEGFSYKKKKITFSRLVGSKI